jgi:hypothetical protein
MTAAAATRLVRGPRCRAEPPRSVRSRDDVPVIRGGCYVRYFAGGLGLGRFDAPERRTT